MIRVNAEAGIGNGIQTGDYVKMEIDPEASRVLSQ